MPMLQRGCKAKVRIMALAKMLLVQEKGATSIEYGLIAAFLVLGCFTAYRGLGTATIEMWDRFSAKVMAVDTQ